MPNELYNIQCTIQVPDSYVTGLFSCTVLMSQDIMFVIKESAVVVSNFVI